MLLLVLLVLFALFRELYVHDFLMIIISATHKENG